MYELKRVLALVLVFSLAGFVPTPFTESTLARAEEPAAVYQQPSGTFSLTKSVSETEPAPEISEVPSSIPSETTAAFFSEGPLSPAEDYADGLDDVLYDFRLSDDPFYGTSGSWGQSYEDLWWLKRINADDAWSLSTGTDVPVAVIDTGLDYHHPDIAANRWYNPGEVGGIPGVDDDGNGFVDDFSGWDYYNWDNDPLDDNGHGTHVSGIIAAVKDNGIGIAGIAPESKIIPIKVLNNKGSGYVSDVIDAIYYAADLGAKVINMSLGVAKAYLTKFGRTAFENAVTYAIQKGSVVVAAAGNNGGRVENTYPAGIKNLIAVGATDVTNNRAWFSNYGKLLDFVAPGVDILSLRAGGTLFGSNSVVDPGYSRASGTSMASPMVAGIAALLQAYYPLITPSQVYDRLKASAVDLGAKGFDVYYGYGLVDAFGALTVSLTEGSSPKKASKKASSTSTGGQASGTSSGQTNGNSSAGQSNESGFSFAPSFFLGRGSLAGTGAIGTWYEIKALRSRFSAFHPLQKKEQELSWNHLLFWHSRAVRPH